MSGDRPLYADHEYRTACLISCEPHRPLELGPRGTGDEGILVPRSRRSSRGRRRRGNFDRCLRAFVLNQAIVPVGAFLVPQQDEVRRHRILGIRLLQVLGERRSLTRRRLHEHHVVDVGRGRRRWCLGANSRGGGKDRDEKRASNEQSSQRSSFGKMRGFHGYANSVAESPQPLRNIVGATQDPVATDDRRERRRTFERRFRIDFDGGLGEESLGDVCRKAIGGEKGSTRGVRDSIDHRGMQIRSSSCSYGGGHEATSEPACTAVPGGFYGALVLAQQFSHVKENVAATGDFLEVAVLGDGRRWPIHSSAFDPVCRTGRQGLTHGH